MSRTGGILRILGNAWGTGSADLSIKFFAESVLELTNIYSAPSYRHRTLSTPSKANELRQALREVRSRVVKKPYLTPVIAEYSHSIRTDPIVSSILKSHDVSAEFLTARIEDPLEKISAKVSIFYDLVYSRYSDAAVALITSACASGRREKDLLRKCADHYISHLVVQGISREHIHVSAKRNFSVQDTVGRENEALASFFSSCTLRDKNYDILINVSEQVGGHLSSTLPAEYYKSSNELPSHFRYSSFGKGGLNKEGGFAIVSSVPGRDPFSAVKNLKFTLEILHAFHFVFPNGERWTLPTSACAFEDETGAVYHSNLSDYVHEGRRVGNLAQHRELISNLTKFTFDKIQNKTGIKIVSALQSASAASRISEPDARLISIWSAFEALLPHPSKDGESTVRINHFESYITPLVTAGYIDSIFMNFYKDLARNFKGKFYNFLRSHGEGATRYEKFISLFFAEESIKRRFTDLIGHSELLMHRAYELEKLANSPSAIRSKINDHGERVSWQLHRIYRARNSIVHSGRSPQASSQLTENAFSYFKSLMAILVQAGEKFGVSNSDSLFELCASICRDRKDNLLKVESSDVEVFFRAAISTPFA